MEKLVLIDGNSLINRAFYAMPLLTTKDGTPTNAVYGFMNMFIKMLSDVKPNYVCVAFDLKAPTFRHKIYSEYKGTRKPMPEELRPQIPLLKEVLTLMGVCIMEKEGSEADDIIGTIAKATDVMTYIFTGDKDSFQLVDNETEVHFTRRGITDVEIYTQQNFKEKMGIDPIQIIQLKALMGDSSDNIPGIPGVGEKTALNLVQTYGNVDNLYAHVDELKGKLKEKVEQNKDLAYLSQTLATIDVNVSIDTDLNKMVMPFPFSHAVKDKFAQLEFKSLANKTELFDFDPQEGKIVQDDTVTLSVQTVSVADLSVLDDVIANGKAFSLYLSDKNINLFDGKSEYVMPVMLSLLDVGFGTKEILTALSPVFTGQKPLTVYSKKDLKHLLLSVCDLQLTCPTDDLSLLKYLVDYSNNDTADGVIEEYGKQSSTPAYSISVIATELSNKLDDDTQKLYRDIELPLSDVLFDMEIAGFKVDADSLYKTGDKYKKEIAIIESQIRELSGEENLNVNSPKQLGEVLFEKLKIGKGKKTKTGYSTSAEVLEALEFAHPVVSLILQYRKIQKLLSTYIDGFKPLIDGKTGLVHTSFNQTVTATGRLSSKEPNLQNIPVRDDMGRELRKFFVSRFDGGSIIGADYSQIELRLMADFSKCSPLIDAFNHDEDVHKATASKVFKTPLSEVTGQMRSRAKAVNFGIIYGISEYGLAKQLKISPAEARGYIIQYFAEYPEVKKYMDYNVEYAKRHGYSITLLGRKRFIRELASPNYNIRQFGERVAMNMPLQGSSADIIKLAMLGVFKRLKNEGLKSKLILQVHDELIIDAFPGEEDAVKNILKEEMENATNLSVKLTVSVGSGKTWFDAK